MNKIHSDQTVKLFTRGFFHFVQMQDLLDIGIDTETVVKTTTTCSVKSIGTTEFVFIDIFRCTKYAMSDQFKTIESIIIRFHTNTGDLAYDPFSYFENSDEVLSPSLPIGKYIKSKEKILNQPWTIRKSLSTDVNNLDEVIKNYGLL